MCARVTISVALCDWIVSIGHSVLQTGFFLLKRNTQVSISNGGQPHNTCPKLSGAGRDHPAKLVVLEARALALMHVDENIRNCRQSALVKCPLLLKNLAWQVSVV